MESTVDSMVLTGTTIRHTTLPGHPSDVASDSLYNTLPTPLSFRLFDIITVFPYLSCKMRSISLTDHTPYHALSYCWGSPDRSITLRCNGFRLKISSNLAKGLKRLHSYAVEANLKSFWVDQICINQEDDAERAQQVRMMRSIYQRSTHTIIWLPLKNEVAKAAKNILVHLNFVIHTDSIQLPPMHDGRWSALAQLLESPWFERCWILQEMAVSRGCPEMLCGNQRLSWSEFQEAIDWLNKSGSKHRTERMELVNSIQEVIGRHHWNLGLEDTVSHLHALLRLTSSFRSTDPRDKIFALLGLSSASRYPENWPDEVAPEYTRGLLEVYAGAAKYCIRQTSSLSVLSQFVHNKMAGSTALYPHFPSWVPRWDIADSTLRISAFSVLEGPHRTRILKEKHNNASMHTRVEMDQNTPLGVLRLLGTQIDTVNVCLPTVMPDDAKFHAGVPERYGDYLSDLLPQLYKLCKKHVKHVSPSFDLTFFLVTTAGLTPEDWDARWTSRSDAQSAFESIVNPPQAERATEQGPASNTKDLPQQHSTESCPLSPNSSRGRYPNRYIASLQRLMNRRLFITSSDHIGLGPAGMMSGDTVAILFGGNVPYILRPSGDKQWHFVGECYLGGYMEGEAMESRSHSRDEWFELV